jgi:hypothetical protein
VAGIGGVVQRVLDPLMDEIIALPFEGKLRRLLNSVLEARDRLKKAVEFVEARNDSDYFDLMAGRLCRMETIIYVSLLLLRDARIDRAREAVAECFIRDSLAQFEGEAHTVMSGDFAVIDNHEDILAM